MAIHPNTASMLKESLRELCEVAEYCVQYRKDPVAWGAGGCYGYPAAILLFSVVDSIGSYFRGKADFTVPIEGRARKIDGDGFKHFFILNSEYYRQTLAERFIKALYDNYRSLLMHNAALAPNHYMDIGSEGDPAFLIQHIDGAEVPFVLMVPFLLVTRDAVSMFIREVDRVVAESEQGKIIQKKKL